MRIISLLLLILLSACTHQTKQAQLKKADKVVVYKSLRKLHLLQSGTIIQTYPIALGDNPVGHKQQEGDEKTPEGNYVLDWRNRQSAYHKSIHISYPNEQDKLKARSSGVSPGGSIMIHGMNKQTSWLGGVQHWRDWTNGCIGLANDDMDEVWAMVENGTAIDIKP